MLKKIKQHINNLANPLLFYVDKNGHSVFRNFCLLKNNGNLFDKVIPIKEAGKVLEYRIELSKKLSSFAILLTVIVYLLFIHILHSRLGLILCEIIWVSLFLGARIISSYLFSKKLQQTYGEYTVTNFRPKISKKKKNEYKKYFLGKCTLISAAILIFLTFGVTLSGLIKFNANKKNPNYKIASALSSVYIKFYPKAQYIYEIKAIGYYKAGEFAKAVKYYTKALDMEGRHFSEKDYSRFANLLYLGQKSEGAQYAIDIFNEYATKKHTTIEQQAKLLWIKSMFSLANGIPEFVEKDYDDLITALESPKYRKKRFYVMSDKAYMLYLTGNYNKAISIYDALINYANEPTNKFEQELKRLYVERGFAKHSAGDRLGADKDFAKSQIEIFEIDKYEPKVIEPALIIEKF